MNATALVLAGIVMMALTAAGFPTPWPVTSSLSCPRVVATARDVVPDEDEAEVDAYGNEVVHAVAEYLVDPAGGEYERHAPRITIPRLASPKS